jgi:hypothetical protein
MQKSSFLKVVPFVVTMALGIYISGLLAPSSEEISVGHSDSKAHHCSRIAEGLECNHIEKRGQGLLNKNEELQKRVIELEQRLEAIENEDQPQPMKPVAPIADTQTPIS